MELTSSLLEEPVPDLEAPYRKSFYGAGPAPQSPGQMRRASVHLRSDTPREINWDTAPKPLQPDEADEATALTRRHKAQTVALPQGADVTYKVQMDDVDMRQEVEEKGTPGQAQAAERSSKADVAKQNFCTVFLLF